MGPLRFELRSEDPQSPRMARLPYGPALLLYDYIIYLSCYKKLQKNYLYLKVRCNSYVGINPVSARKISSSGIFIQILSFLLLNRRKKKDMYICFNQIL